jgi:cytochrome c oxidase subunit 1
VIFAVNFILSIVKGKKAITNPWQAATLEWTVDYPIPHGNFEQVPNVVNGPHEYSHPLIIGKDWVAQSEPIPSK